MINFTPPRRSTHSSAIIDEKVFILYTETDLPIKDIGKQAGIGTSAVMKRLLEMKVPRRYVVRTSKESSQKMKTLHEEEGWSIHRLCVHFHMSSQTVRRCLKEVGSEVKSHQRTGQTTERRVMDLYLRLNERPEVIAKKLKLSPSTVHRIVEASGKKKTFGYWMKGNSNRFKGRSVNHGGYIIIAVDKDHPFANAMKARLISGESKKYVRVLEHRWNMALHLGRPLEKWELVHHIDHVRTNNEISNLKLMSCTTEHRAETVAHAHFLALKKENEKLRAMLEDYRQNNENKAAST